MKRKLSSNPKPYSIAYFKLMFADIKMYYRFSRCIDDEGYSYFKDGWKGIFITIKYGLLGKPLRYTIKDISEL